MSTYSHAPYLRDGDPTPVIKTSYLAAALTGVGILTVYYNGPRALLLTLLSVLMAMAYDALACLLLRDRIRFSADSILQAILLTLLCPSTAHLMLPAVGVAVMMTVKYLLRQFLPGRLHLSPVCVGWTMLALCFPDDLFSYAVPGAEHWPTLGLTVTTDRVSSAAALLKMGAEAKEFSPVDLLLGNLAGPMGACGAVVLAAVLVFLCLRYHTPARSAAGAIAAVAICALLFPRVPDSRLLSVLFEVFSGSFLFCCAFLLFEPGSVPLSGSGQWCYGVVFGLLVVLSRRAFTLEQTAPLVLLFLIPLTARFDYLCYRVVRRCCADRVKRIV